MSDTIENGANISTQKQKCKFPNAIQRLVFHHNMIENGLECMPTRKSLLKYRRNGIDVHWDEEHGLTVRVQMEPEEQEPYFIYPVEEWIPDTFEKALSELSSLRIFEPVVFSLDDIEEAA